MEIIIAIVFAIVYILYRIYRYAMQQSQREKEFWEDRRVYRNDFFTKLYAILKIILLFVAITAGLFVFVSLANGHTPPLRDFSDPKSRELILGAGFLLLVQIGVFGLIALARKGMKFEKMEVILFFGAIFVIAAALLAAICLAAN